MQLFTVEADGSPLGIASTTTSEAAVSLVRRLCWVQEAAEGKCDFQPFFRLSVRPANASETGVFQKCTLSGGVRLACMLVHVNLPAT